LLSLEQVDQKTRFTATLLIGSEFNTCVTQKQELFSRIPIVTVGWQLRTTGITTCLGNHGCRQVTVWVRQWVTN